MVKYSVDREGRATASEYKTGRGSGAQFGSTPSIKKSAVVTFANGRFDDKMKRENGGAPRPQLLCTGRADENEAKANNMVPASTVVPPFAVH